MGSVVSWCVSAFAAAYAQPITDASPHLQQQQRQRWSRALKRPVPIHSGRCFGGFRWGEPRSTQGVSMRCAPHIRCRSYRVKRSKSPMCCTSFCDSAPKRRAYHRRPSRKYYKDREDRGWHDNFRLKSRRQLQPERCFNTTTLAPTGADQRPHMLCCDIDTASNFHSLRVL